MCTGIKMYCSTVRTYSTVRVKYGIYKLKITTWNFNAIFSRRHFLNLCKWLQKKLSDQSAWNFCSLLKISIAITKITEIFFTFSSHTEYVKRESIVIAWVKEKKFSPFDECSCFVCLRRQTKRKKISVCLSGCLSVWLSGCTYVDFSCGHNNFRRS